MFGVFVTDPTNVTTAVPVTVIELEFELPLASQIDTDNVELADPTRNVPITRN